MLNRRDEARSLTEALLQGYETGHLEPADLARNGYRLARLLDDADAQTWLLYEVVGFPREGTLPAEAWAAAVRSNRTYVDSEGTTRANTLSLGQLSLGVRTATVMIDAAADRPVSVSSANPAQWVTPPPGNSVERVAARQQAVEQQGLIDRVAGAIFDYVVTVHYQLRFGSAVETAFEVVRADVDANIARLVPAAPRRLAAAFESAASSNPEHWAAAAATCRRLLKDAADELRPSGPDVAGRRMGPDNYVNRLVDWISQRETSGTAAGMVSGELEHLGQRLDAVAGAGNQGAHGEVGRLDASRYLMGTYLLLGDLLRLSRAEPTSAESH